MRCARLWFVVFTLFTPLLVLDCSGSGYVAEPKEYCVNDKWDQKSGETDEDCGGKCEPCKVGKMCKVDGDCNSGLTCLTDPSNGPGIKRCQAAHCGDDKRNDDESDVDCGGSCWPCDPGQKCKSSGDCSSKLCNEGLCLAASCVDGVRNQDESDVDCGSQQTTCDKCGGGKSCTTDVQCDSGICDFGKCAQASCNDSQKNGDEGGVDCGGSCPTRCGSDSACNKDADCGSNVCRNNVCVGAQCGDGVRNGTESDVDCGGACGANCVDTAGCNSDADCLRGFCSNHICAKPTCDDGIKNQGESDVDCGDLALVCPRCAPGKVCLYPSSCDSYNCLEARCITRTCDDFIKNGLEGDVDCGGDCLNKCPVGGACRQMTDCVEGVCTDNRCIDDTCSDAVKNGQETDVDCGGPSCPNRCDNGLKCVAHSDCKINSCASGTCADPQCTNSTLDGSESDVDCGGERCGKCMEANKCKRNEDCMSLNCVNLICAAASCTDRIQNGRETSVDCGGDCAKKCEVGQTCSVGTDCRYGVCSGGVCKAAACDDLVKNDLETDTDCGGAVCTALTAPRLCAKGQGCSDDSDCRAKLICDAATGKCADWSCTDQRKNQDETDVDCGGTVCGGCATNKICKVPSDCRDGKCGGDGRCVAPACNDDLRNGDESDVNCGGSVCGTPCANGKFCNVASDCQSGVCSSTTPRVCLAPLCNDKIKNGTETDIDCGGSCSTKCADGKLCAVTGDCANATAVEPSTCKQIGEVKLCSPPDCGDGDKNNDETDVDCGGSCSPCGLGKQCVNDADCSPIASGKCSTAKVCVAATCSDLARNGAESDVDCGGTDSTGTYPTCNRCPNGKKCSIPSDCTSKSCNGTCLPPTCSDDIQNGSEVGVDCGASCASFGKLCADATSCNSDADCSSGWCNATKKCQTRTCADGILNGAEGDKDCGAICGSAAQLCKVSAGQGCKVDADCDSGTCSECSGKCINASSQCYAQPPTLTTCAQCNAGGSCSQDFDCKSLNCDATTKKCVAADTCPGKVLETGACTENCKTVLRCLFANNCKLGDACASGSGICGSNTLRFDMSPYDAAKAELMRVCPRATALTALGAYCNTITTCL